MDVLYGLFILHLTNAITNRRISSNYDYEEPYFFLHFSQSGNRYVSLPVTRLVKVQWLANDDLTNRCEISEDPDQVHNSLKGIPHERVKRVSERQMEGIINSCNQSPQLPIETLPSAPQKIKPVFIWPGTRWCGTGNVSSGLDDLGWYREEDKCCREHDLCGDIIQAGGTKDELVNDSKYTRLLCSCDDRFWHCLREVNSITSNAIGDFYFNLFQNQCFRMEHPIIQCVAWHSKLLKKRCQEYEFDYTKPKIWQWFDAKVYTKL
uniref:Phospholipase A2 n=1 Tax=Megacormus gertschi TaxID=1843536 RepID=A0A224XGJ6_9SCOR